MSREPLMNRESGVWLRMRPRLMERIERLRDDLETLQDPVMAARTQGEIGALRWIIAEVEPDLPDGPPTPTVGVSSGY